MVITAYWRSIKGTHAKCRVFQAILC